MNASYEIDDSGHGTSAMPNAFKSVSACANDCRCFLSATSSPLHCRQIITHQLQCIEEIIQILNLNDWFESSHGKTNSLTKYRGLTDACIGNAQESILCLQSTESLIHIAQLSYIFAECHNAWIIIEMIIKTCIHDFRTIHKL